MAKISTEHFSLADDQFLDTLYATLPDAILGVDSGSGRILHWNNAATVLFGWSAQDVVGKSLDVIFADPANFPSFFGNFLSEIRKRVTWDTKCHVRGSNCVDFYAELTATLGRRHGANDEYLILVFHQRNRTENADDD